MKNSDGYIHCQRSIDRVLVSRQRNKRSWRFSPGEIVAERRVVARLGGGGRTEVYRCVDGSGASVAVKVLRPGRTGERDVRVLQREAATLNALDHPGFPRLVDADLEAEPAWIGMTLVDGPHLSEHVRAQGLLEVEAATALAQGLAEALDHLHARGRVHLDVKPSNIVLGTPPVLLDLGASRMVTRAETLRPRVGTLTYLAPEQAAPSTFGPPGPASDVWGLGMVLLRVTTGANPLVQRREDHPPDEDVLAAACREAAADVPATLREGVRACLATVADDRPTAEEVIGLVTPRR